MMAYSEDHIALAAEYALGTLDANERADVEAMMAADQGFAGVVDAWQNKLGVLNQMVGSVEPRAEVWERIKAEIGKTAEQSPLSRPGAPQVAANDAAEVRTMIGPNSDSANVILFSQQARRWRGIATAVSALAAVLVAMVFAQAYRPDLLPESIRPKSAQPQVAQVKPTPAAVPAQYVALLQKDPSSPAFILTVDAGSKNFTVRKVEASNEPGKSYELWLVSDKLQRPRSLGVIGGNDFTTRPALASYDADTVSKATYAVTTEPEGGSPSGEPTGPIVFSGKLIESVPQSAPATSSSPAR